MLATVPQQRRTPLPGPRQQLGHPKRVSDGEVVVAVQRFRVMTIAVLTMLGLMLSTFAAAPVASAGGSSAPQVPILRKIRAAHHPGYDRLVFEFQGPVPRIAQVRWVDKVYRGESDIPEWIPGNALLRVVFYEAVGHNQSHKPTFGARRRAYDLPNLATVVATNDWEAELRFGVGVMKRTSIIRRMRLRNPSRYVIDVATNFRKARVKAFMFDQARFADGTTPYFRPVRRWVPVPAVARGALHRVYAGPTRPEKARHLRIVRSRSTGFTNLTINRRKIARVQLVGGCNAGGSTASVAGHIRPTLKQFPTVRWVKIYDPSGRTAQPWGMTDSIPDCLNP
jgi:hypothetical protein